MLFPGNPLSAQKRQQDSYGRAGTLTGGRRNFVACSNAYTILIRRFFMATSFKKYWAFSKSACESNYKINLSLLENEHTVKKKNGR
jgi:hypothetical protein